METDNNRKRDRDEGPENVPSKKSKIEENDDDFSDDSFEFEINLASQKEQYKLSDEAFKNAKAKVKEVFDRSIIVEKLNEKNETTEVFHEVDRSSDWVVKEGDLVYAAPDFGSTPIYHSDTLVSCTNVANAAGCVRRALLSDRFRDGAIGVGNVRMLLGNFLHELFQASLQNAIVRKMNITSSYLEGEMAKITSNNIREIIACGVSQTKMLVEAKPYYDVMSKMISKLKHGVQLEMKYTMKDNINRTESLPSEVKIESLRDIEENVWEPRLGLKGKVDVTAKCTVKNRRGNKVVTIPMELKSGKGNSVIQEHQIQTQLYGMIQSFRHDTKETTFKDTTSLLMYIRTGNAHSIPIKSNEIDQILQKRNVFAGHARHPFTDKDTLSLRPLPPPIDHAPKLCENCFQRPLCAFFTKAEERHHAVQAVQEAFDLDTEHINKSAEEYMLRWIKLGLLEQSEEEKSARGRELWNSESDSTISGVKIEPRQERLDTRVRITAKLPLGVKWTFGSKSTKNVERLAISTETKVAVAFAYCNRIIPAKVFRGPIKVELLVDRYLSPEDGPFRIDSANNVGGGAFGAKLWLGNVWVISTPEMVKLRKILVGETRPLRHLTPEQAIKKDVMIDVIKNRGWNQGQKRALKNSLTARHFALIQGFPGTGKSKTIAALCEILIRSGKRILLTAHTHNAVDNVLEKVLKRLSRFKGFLKQDWGEIFHFFFL